MITTSMGSLPFTDAKVAVDYAFKFNLPFFPELANASENELLIARLEYFYHSKDSRQFCDDVFKRKVLEEKPHKIKWQVVCPLTFFRYQKFGLTQKEVSALLKEYIKERLSFFRSFYEEEIYLCLDAPGILFEKDELLYLRDFLLFIKEEKIKTGLHLCQKIEKTFRLESRYFDFLCFDALLNHKADLDDLYTIFEFLIYGVYDFRQNPPKIPSLSHLRLKDGISTVCGLNAASEEALASCLDCFTQLK